MNFAYKKQGRRGAALTLAAAFALAALTGCAAQDTGTAVQETLDGNSAASAATAPVAEATGTNPDAALYSDRDWDASYDGAEVIDCTGESAIHITSEGVYRLTGTLNGSVVVEANKTDKVQLVLDNLTVNSPDGPAIWVKSADKVFLTLPQGSVSTLSDSATYSMLTDDEPNAAVFVDCDLTIQGSGTLNVTGSYDHAIRAKDDLTVTGGVLNLSGVDKGLKAKTTLAIGGGSITVTESTEGVEANDIIVTGGVLDVTATDDGINASSPNNWTGAAPTVQVRGGTVLVNAAGDGVDSNGTLAVSGGVLLVAGPTDSGNGALDYETGATVTGGVVMAVGAAGMAAGFGSDSTQGSWMANITAQTGGTSLTLVDAEGSVLAHWTPAKDYSNVVVSAPGLTQGGSYSLLAGAAVEGTDGYGFAQQGTATGGTELATTAMDSLTQNDAGGMGGHGGMGGMMGGRKADGEMPTDGGTPPELPDGEMPADGGTPPELPNGEMPTDGGTPPEMPDGAQAAGGAATA